MTEQWTPQRRDQLLHRVSRATLVTGAAALVGAVGIGLGLANAATDATTVAASSSTTTPAATSTTAASTSTSSSTTSGTATAVSSSTGTAVTASGGS